jgi:hypothetical protein
MTIVMYNAHLRGNITMGTFSSLYIPPDLIAPQRMVMNAVGRDQPEYHCDFSFSFPPLIRVCSIFSLFFDKPNQNSK